MTERQRLELRAGEIRQKLAELGGNADLSTEQRGEIDTLRTEYQNVEARSAAMLIADDQPTVKATGNDAEGRELRALVSRADVGRIFDNVLEHRSSSGAEAELQKHYALGSNQVPLSLLTGTPVEYRAVTPAPSNVGQNQDMIIPAVFPASCAAFLGVDMPTVGVGEAVYPVLTSVLSVETLAENAEGTETTGAFSADVLSPGRLQASFWYSREDRARFVGMAEALRQNLNEGLADALDKQIISGTNGLLTGTNLANNNQSGISDFADYKSKFAYGRVDGQYAMGTEDLRIVMGSGTYAHAATIYRDTTAEDDALSALKAATAGVKVSAHVPDVSNANKQDAVIRLGMRRDMVAPIWEGVTLIPDEVTKAATGSIVVTAVMLYAVKILRAAGFHKQQSQHA